ncbi:DUF742 domain-containing protein [Saccharothrix longispora]|uniref:DUF742 domain-containing protein n=1 Tax=Saccharothrix longispora TaxID=33920 RepID=UPI0028FDB613|nr:DUF742 domain-containing protein [Saccharothrix longispora]MDU0292220.1 DUF742 domain-containing protein [Saccharothrix longispora]
MSTPSSDPEPTGGGERKRRRSPRGEVGTTGARFGSPALRRGMDGQDVEVPRQPRRRRSLRGEVGATGARFGSAALRRSLDGSDEPDEPDRRDGQDDRTRPSIPLARSTPAPAAPHPPPREPEPVEEFPEPVEEFSGPLVRPYAWTGGRTSSHHDLRLETLVSLEENGVAIAMRESTAEQRSIVEVCATRPRSVAEVSALLTVPLGVARVVLGDLISMGVVAVHDNAAAPGGPDLALLERVLAGLRHL